MLRVLRLLFVILVMLTGLAVHLRNDQTVIFDYYLGTFETPLSLLLILALITGALLGVLACLPGLLRVKREKRTLQARIRVIEKELNELRVIPVRN